MLIGFMGGQNFPELANRAGDEVLPQSDSENSNGRMEIDAASATTDQSPDPANLAENVLPLAEDNVGETESKQDASKVAGPSRPELPRLFTEDEPSSPTIARCLSGPAYEVRATYEDADALSPERQPSRAATDGPSGLGINGIRSGKSTQTNESQGNQGTVPKAISPGLRRFTVPSAAQTPGDTLPAMQASPQVDPAKSPSLPQGLPSLHDSGLKEVLDGAPPKNGFPSQPTSTAANAVLSPPMSSKAAHFPSPKSRSNSTFSNFPHGHPSPAYSNASPRDSANMSPPSRPNVQMSPFPPRSGSDALTPQSADSYTSSYNGAPSPAPVTEAMEIDRAGRVLPPLVPHPGPPIINGIFRCKHEGCNAAPFQTQYLLK